MRVFDSVRCPVTLLLVFATAAFAISTGLQRDIEYGRADGERLLLDASVPEGAGPFPVAILVHGGGWKRGDKSGSDKPGDGADISPWFEALNHAKLTWFSINYRLMPAHPWPAPFEDVQTAIRWVRTNAVRFKGDPTRLALFGHSAGGHLVALTSARATDDTRVQAVVAFAPVTYFDPMIPRRDGLNPAVENLGNIPNDLPADLLPIIRRPAPIEHVNASMPPFLIIHGDADKTVPLPRTLIFQEEVRAAGVRCDVIVIKGGPHSLIEGRKIEPSYQPAMIAWLSEVLGKQKSADTRQAP